MTEGVLWLPDDALEGLGITPDEVADAIEAALIDKAEGRLLTSPKSALLPGDGRYMMSTLAVGDFIVVKQVSVCPDNPGRDLPAINGAIMVLDAQTGLLRAVLGANWVTAVRTAALSAVAARRMAPKNAETIAFVGAGVQAVSHLDAFRAMFPLKTGLILGRGRANIERLSTTLADRGMDAVEASDPEAALREADIVVTSVTLDYSIEPFLDARWLKPGAFAAITDLCIPWIGAGQSAFGTVIVDDRLQEESSEKPMLPYEMVSGDLTELVTGTASGVGDGKPTAFAFRGIALGDYAAAALAVNRAED